MKKRVSSILILIFIMIVIFCTISCNNTNITNAFFASGNNVDMYIPKVNVSNYTENAIVRGPVVFCGEASDDIWVYSVELYYICLFKNEDGTHEMRDVRIAAAKQSGKNIKWEIPCDTTQLPDASTIFRIRVIDDASNIYMRNLTLRLDNHGPDIMINSPVANKKQNAIDNTFVCAVVPIEIDINRISQLNWRLVKNDNPKVFISGIENYQDNPLPSNKTCSFYINPFGLTECEGYEPGYYHLEIIGYSVPDGTTGELGKPSQKAAISDNLYIDFSGSVPKVMLTAPSSTNRSLPTISSSSVVFAGAAVDDNGVDNVELRWGHDGSDEPIGEQKLTFDTPNLSRTFAYTEQNLAEGLYWVQVRATDIMPNVSGWSEKYYFRVDTNLPTISWNSPIQGQWYRSGVTFSSDMSILGDNVALTNVQFRLPPKYSDWITVPAANLVNPDDMSAIVLPSQRVRLQYALPDNDDLYKSGGEYVFGLRAFKSENEFTESSIVVNLDCQPPVTAILSPQSDTQSLNQMLHINGTALDKIGIQSDDDGIIRDVTIDIRWGSTHSVTIPSSEIIGVSNWSYDFDSWTAGIGMENGGEPVNITFTASDYAGNTTVSNVTVTVDQSTDIPTVNVNNFADGDKKYGIFTVTGIAADDDGIQAVQVFMTDNTTDATEDVLRNEMNMLTGRVGEWSRASGMTIWTYMLNLSEVPQGLYRFFYRSVDLNGKPSTYGGLYQGVRFFVDPDIPIIDFDLDTYLSAPKSFSGTVTKNAAAGDDVTVAKIEYRLASTQASGSWTPFVVGQNMTYDDASHRSAAFRLDYNQSLIDRFGQGEVTVYIRATDSSDRQSVVSSKTFVDTIAPTATLSALTNNVIRQNSVIISGGVSDEEPSSGLYSDGCSLRYSYNGQNYETAVNGASIGGLSSFSTPWTIPSTVKDGVIDIRLFAADKAGNELGSSAALQNVRLARYTPQLSNITINGVAAADYMYVRKDVNISCHIEDNDPNDTAVKGVTKIGVYAIKSANFSQYNIDSENVSGFVKIAEQTYAASPTSVDWTKSYSFSQSYDYILFRAFDKAGGWSDKVYHITVDSVAPTEAFRYSTVGHVYTINSGTNHVGDQKWEPTSRTVYSDTLWVKLEAKDKLNNADAGTELTGTTAVLGVGTSAGENDIAEAKIYTLGSGIAKLDLKGYTQKIYLNYKITDKAGN
ncbi:MAG: hypothetical protein II707_03900, partial [Spirochaetales bacterium]|nr:hypothetical protein [Spirochaetales bacterium]